MKSLPTHILRKRARQRYGASAWDRDRRKRLRAGNFLCEQCQREGRIAEATDLDHVQPLHLFTHDFEAFYAAFIDPHNMQILCGDCHEQKRKQEVAPARLPTCEHGYYGVPGLLTSCDLGCCEVSVAVSVAR